MPRLAEAPDEAAALEQLHAGNMTDGLPVVIPTRRRVDALVLAGGLDGDVVLGTVGPAQGAATLHAVATNAVMAGCLPAHFPVVIAGVQALCDPVFDLTEVQVTTHSVTPLVIVNGPARAACELSSGTGCLGPGPRANASIGRALRLVMMNIGGGRPGLADMTVYGHPAKFSFCAAEDEAGSPWEPLHVSRGLRAEQSAVTVVATEGPHTVCCVPVPDGLQDREADIWISLIASAIGTTGANSTYFERGTITVILNAQLAGTFARAGHTRRSLQEQFVARSRHRRGYLRGLNPGLIAPGADDDVVHRDPATIMIVVTGGGGHYVMVCPTLGVGPHNNSPVTREISINPSCEFPLQQR